MGICSGKAAAPRDAEAEKEERNREEAAKTEAAAEERSRSNPWASPFFPFYTPSPLSGLFSKKSPSNGRVSAGATPGRLFRPFLPPSPAKHIRALLARRQGPAKGGEAAAADGEAGRGLDKSFGFSKGFEGRYEMGEEVGRGHFGYTCCARARKGELKGEIVAVKIIPKAKVKK